MQCLPQVNHYLVRTHLTIGIALGDPLGRPLGLPQLVGPQSDLGIMLELSQFSSNPLEGSTGKVSASCWTRCCLSDYGPQLLVLASAHSLSLTGCSSG